MNKRWSKIFLVGFGMYFLSTGVQRGSAEPLEKEPFIEGEVEQAGNLFSHGQWDVAGDSLPIERPGARFIRLRFSNISISSSSADYPVVLIGRVGQVLDRVPKTDLDGRDNYWSRSLYGDFVRVIVDKIGGFSITVAEIAFQKGPAGGAFSLPPESDLEPIVNYRNNLAIATRGRAVAKLQFVDDKLKSCTGFLIDDSRMLTNNHCIDRQEVCDSTMAIFGYELTEGGGLNLGEQFRCVKLLGHDPELDVSLLKLGGAPGIKWGNLEINSRAVLKGEQAYIIQYPAGQPKFISRTRCFITSVGTGVNFGHKCSTLNGSSGSPVLGSDLTVVGLHHLGFDLSDNDWRDQNRATRTGQIAEWIRHLPDDK